MNTHQQGVLSEGSGVPVPVTQEIQQRNPLTERASKWYLLAGPMELS